MKILITGASGFIGQYLTNFLANKHTIYTLKNDLLDFEKVKQEVIEVDPEIIVHLAARTEVEKSFYEQTTFSNVNYTGTVNLIEAAKELKNFKNFVFASTMEVYGWQPISDEIKNTGKYTVKEVFDENTLPNPNAPYAVAKYACEKYLEYAKRAYGLPYTILRQTNTYGRADNSFFVTEQIITQMLQGTEVKLGYKLPYRNFLFISDLLEVWNLVINNPDIGIEGYIFTLGPNNAISIQKYVELIAKKLKWKGLVFWDTKPVRAGEIYWLNSDSILISKIINWSPKISLDEGLDKTIDIWRNK